jgi:hypothetical protein
MTKVERLMTKDFLNVSGFEKKIETIKNQTTSS